MIDTGAHRGVHHVAFVGGYGWADKDDGRDAMERLVQRGGNREVALDDGDADPGQLFGLVRVAAHDPHRDLSIAESVGCR